MDRGLVEIVGNSWEFEIPLVLGTMFALVDPRSDNSDGITFGEKAWGESGDNVVSEGLFSRVLDGLEAWAPDLAVAERFSAREAARGFPSTDIELMLRMRAGCRIVAAARRSDRLKSLWDEINQQAAANDPSAAQPRAVAVQLDLSLLCLDSAWTVKNPLELPEEEWNQVMWTNLRGSWLVAKHVCIHMHGAKRGGSVINFSSLDGLNHGHLPGALAYAASKSGINTMTKVMAMELGVFNIRVNAIAPGLFKSKITQDLWKKDWFAKIESTMPLGTFGAIDLGLTSLARYLIHDSSQYVSGNIFLAEAGSTLQCVPLPLLLLSNL
ncbi:hypothetical protein Tsubulata_011397 [Turnera subulata]|uniref:Uncharacterized protein n=1 Tax=Turnera subulata TaxID=218843 RepID=A0A9Q0G6P6_9ROSI|nr:hypothetical protein Tsubulata_011397 [Turnera subulata]